MSTTGATYEYNPLDGTGATREQVEGAAITMYDYDVAALGLDWGSARPSVRNRRIFEAAVYATYLVDTSKRIVDIDDLDALCEAGDYRIDYLRQGGLTAEADALSATVDRLRAAIGTPTVDPVCPRCQERTYESPRTGRTCVRNECGWRERE